MQYTASAIFPLPSQSLRNFSGKVKFGNAYIAPSLLLHVTPVNLFKPSTNFPERLFKLAKMSAFSFSYNAYDASPSTGGVHTWPIKICPLTFGHKLRLANFNN